MTSDTNYTLNIYGERVPVMVGVDVLFDGAWHPVALLPRSEAVSRFGGRPDFRIDGKPA